MINAEKPAVVPFEGKQLITAKNKNQNFKEKFKSINMVKKEIVTGVFSQANSADSWDFDPFLSELVSVFVGQSV